MKQNKKWSMRIASFCLAGACLCGGAVLAAGGDESDPLVTLSYLTQTVTPNILKQVDEQAAKRQSELLAQLNTAIADYKSQATRPSRKASASRIQPHSNAKRQLIKLACSS